MVHQCWSGVREAGRWRAPLVVRGSGGQIFVLARQALTQPASTRNNSGSLSLMHAVVVSVRTQAPVTDGPCGVEVQCIALQEFSIHEGMA